jgi:hypothetical protein
MNPAPPQLLSAHDLLRTQIANHPSGYRSDRRVRKREIRGCDLYVEPWEEMMGSVVEKT